MSERGPHRDAAVRALEEENSALRARVATAENKAADARRKLARELLEIDDGNEGCAVEDRLLELRSRLREIAEQA